jgi:hypothetical protein
MKRKTFETAGPKVEGAMSLDERRALAPVLKCRSDLHSTSSQHVHDSRAADSAYPSNSNAIRSLPTAGRASFSRT